MENQNKKSQKNAPVKVKKKIEESLEIPQDVTLTISNCMVTVKGPKGEVKRDMRDPRLKISIEGNEIKFLSLTGSKKDKTQIGSFVSHTKNMIKGVQEGVNYKLKICSGHFPMTVTVSGNTFTVKNFLGEKVPRVYKFNENAKVKVEGEIINVDGIDKEIVSQTAASIETLTRRLGFDRRRFQDGIYIIEKNGIKLANA